MSIPKTPKPTESVASRQIPNSSPPPRIVAVAPEETTTSAPANQASPPPFVDVYEKQNEKKHSIKLGSRESVVLSYCPSCKKELVSTHTKTKPNVATWACVGAGLVIFWPLCWVPLVMDETKVTNHFCNHCGAKVGKVKPFHHE